MPLVLTADRGAVRVITMHRPEQRNAMDTAMLGELLDAVHGAVDDAGVLAVVLAGAGGTFSAGADIREPLDRDAAVRRMELFGRVYELVGSCPKPTVAAVSGACVGGGAEVAAACDIRVADTTARFRFPGAALGFPIGPAKLVGLVGLGSAKDLVLTSRTVDADEAHRLGLVQRLATGDVLDAAVEVATQIAANHADTVRYLKRQFAHFSALRDRIAVENDALRALAEAGGDYGALAAADPREGWRP
jgi:enoyl-CoA hydratase/carnithine racemase